MWKDRSFVIVVIFLLFQIPLVLLFKNSSFEEKKWAIVSSEAVLISSALCALFFSKKQMPQTSKKNPPARATAAEPSEHVLKELSSLKEMNLLLSGEKEIMAKELASAKERVQTLEKQCGDLQGSYTRAVEEKELIRSSKEEHEENVELLKELVKKMKGALFAEIETEQEMRRQHVIEVRALLRKDSAPLPKDVAERRNNVLFVPRGTTDPSLLLLLVSVFAEKLKNLHEHDQNAQLLVRRKFFEELKALRPLHLICLSLDAPAESLIPPSYAQSEEVQKLLEWIRTRVAEAPWEGGAAPVLANPFQGKERWLVVRLDKPFFHDLFLCANQAKP